MYSRFIVLDIETTGHTDEDSIIQIGLVVLEDNQIVERFSTFVRPNIAIPPFIKELTGIDDSMVENAPTFSEIAPTLLTYLENSCFVAHNVDFDLSFLQRELQQCGYIPFDGPVIDTVELARLLFPTEASYKLTQLAESKAVLHDRPHQADSDAEVTAKLLIMMLEKLFCLPLITLQQLKPISERLKSDITEIITTYIEKKLHTYKDENEYDIFRTLALRRLPDTIKTEENNPIPFSELSEAIYKENGLLASVMSNYQYREGQQQMSDQVYHAFLENDHALIEAGTGTGKSLAYLLPAIFFSKERAVPVIISTYTIPLQQQLLEKDVPIAKKVIPFDFTAALLKGRNHYICLRKFEQTLTETSHDHYDISLSKGQILVWLTETIYGDYEELNLPSGGKNYWHTIKSDASTCLGRKCPWFSRCFYQRARGQAQKADIVITNHALLMTDIVHEQSLLPTYHFAVLDEAHHLEEAASDRLGLHSDYVSLMHLINRVGSAPGELVEKLTAIAQQWQKQLPPFHPLSSELVSNVTEVKLEIDELYRMIQSFVVSKQTNITSETGRVSYRYYAHREEGSLWAAILESASRTTDFLEHLNHTMRKITDFFEPILEKIPLYQKGIVTDFTNYMEQFEEEKSKIDQLLLEYDSDSVYWIEADVKGAKNATYLYSKPIDVSTKLADDLFGTKKSIVLTSATLTVKNKFSFVVDRLGLYDFAPVTVSIPSPFQFDKQAKLFIPTDLEEIKRGNEQIFIEDIVHKIKKIAGVTNGKMLVLFTSFDMLKKAYVQLKPLIESQTFLIAQGINSGSRAKLIKTFRQHTKAILFGTSSFWEGIDLPGDDLHCLVIVRLPFTPPDQPVIQAKSEKLEEQGKNPFYSLSLPQAILRFKQGVGRLIRTREDRGVIIVLDRRLSQARYGAMFIKSLPSIPIIEKETNEMLPEIEHWLTD